MTTAPAFSAEDADFMRRALQEAHAARADGEVPVGAVVVRDGRVIATGRNRSVRDSDPTAHAEVVALRAAAQAVGNYRLEGCDLYVTLEPCPMCTGAMLHARLRRVVYGARDPRTGTAGSVIDLFALPQLNHRSTAQGGLLASECGALLQDFFREKRRASARRHPLREDALRTPEPAFAGVPGPAGEGASYWQDAPVLDGLRMHYRDVRPAAPDVTIGPPERPSDWLCLHGPANWSQRFDPALRGLAHAGRRAVAPDLIGFGRSDKPKREAFHAAAWHVESLRALVAALDLQRIVVVVEEGHRALGRWLAGTDPARYRGLVVLQEPAAERGPVAAWHQDAPFPDRGHRAGPRAFGRGAGRGAWESAPPSLPHAVPILHAGIDPADPGDDAAWLAEAMEYFAA